MSVPVEERSADSATLKMLKRARELGIETIWDRYEKQLPQCGFGLLGLCCQICMQGPCRIDPFGYGPTRGNCGAPADTIVARNFVRSVAGGASAHIDHARHVALTLLKALEGKAPYEIRDEAKLRAIAERLGVPTEGRAKEEVAKDVALKALEDFTRWEEEETLNWLKLHAPAERVETWKKLGVLPRSADREIAEAMHRTTMGVDADPVNLALAAVKTALVDGYAGLHMATDLQDILFGTPKPTVSEANLGVLREDAVNIVVHGHVPLLSEKVVEWARKLSDEAKKAGAEGGVNVVGVCCTGNEVLMRQGVPMASNYLGQELVVMTGVVEAMVVDVQCIMPALQDVVQCFHTKLITTFPIAKIPGATHVEFTEENADEAAERVVRIAIENFKNRDPRKVRIPDEKYKMMGGFSVEAILDVLRKVDPEDPLKPVIDNIAAGNIRGAVAIVGCNNVKVKQDYNHRELTKELLKNDVLVVGTGCWAYAAAKAGFMWPEATKEYAGEKLASVLEALGKAAGLEEPLPPCWHMGSCVDNSRIITLVSALADKLGVAIKDLPIAASAPEATTEKALAIGTWAVSLGILVHVGTTPPVLGSETFTKILTSEVEKLLGGKILVEPDPRKAAEKILEHINAKRKALGLPV